MITLFTLLMIGCLISYIRVYLRSKKESENFSLSHSSFLEFLFIIIGTIVLLYKFIQLSINYLP